VRKLLVALTVAGLAVALGAVPSAAGSGDLKKFCSTYAAVDASDGGPSSRQGTRLRDTAPADVAEAVGTALDLFEELGDSALEDSTFTGALAEVEGFVVDDCGYEQVDVTMQDYAFSGMPAEVEKGKVAVSLTNEGTELHEFAVFRLKGDATLDDILALPADASEEDQSELVTPVRGAGFAFPGGSDTAFFNLKKTGDYVALCFIPVGTTPDTIQGEGEGGTGPPHFMEGMAAEFEVTS
jgi:hypothetical protein